MVQFSNCFFLEKAVWKKFFTYCVTVKYQFKSMNSLGWLRKRMNKAIKCSFQCKILLKEVKACLNSWLAFSFVYILCTRALPSPTPRLPHPLNDNFFFSFFKILNYWIFLAIIYKWSLQNFLINLAACFIGQMCEDEAVFHTHVFDVWVLASFRIARLQNLSVWKKTFLV